MNFHQQIRSKIMPIKKGNLLFHLKKQKITLKSKMPDTQMYNKLFSKKRN